MASGVLQRVSPVYMTVMRAHLLLSAVLFTLLSVFFEMLFIKLVLLFIALCLFAAASAYVPVYWASIGYLREKSCFHIRRGVILRKEISIPEKAVEYIRLRRLPLERMFGLCTMVFVTPGGRVSLSGIPTEDALRLRRLLTRGA